MGYQVYKNKSSWALYEETWNKETGKKKATCIKQSHYNVIGFNADWTLEQARERKTQLNKESELTRKKLNASARIEHETLVHDVYLPDYLVNAFVNHLLELTTPARHKTILQHWSSSKKALLKLQIKAEALGKKSDKIFIEFEKLKYSTDYSNKLLHVINLWGQFVSDELNFIYKPVKFSSHQKARLSVAQDTKDGVRRRAHPLTPQILSAAKISFKDNDLEDYWNWLFVSLWFGLRPSELDKLLELKNLPLRQDADMQMKVLDVQQGKLKFAKKEHQSKTIPIHSKEQKEALKILESRKCKRPLPKTIQRIIGEGFDTYSGRQGFADLMIQSGWLIEDVAQMLGHSKLDTLFKHYKNKKKFKIPAT